MFGALLAESSLGPRVVAAYCFAEPTYCEHASNSMAIIYQEAVSWEQCLSGEGIVAGPVVVSASLRFTIDRGCPDCHCIWPYGHGDPRKAPLVWLKTDA